MTDRKSRRKITREIREAIIYAYTGEQNMKAYATNTNMSYNTIKNIVKKFRRDGEIIEKKRGGSKPYKMTPEVKKFVLDLVEHPTTAHYHLNEITNEVAAMLGIDVSTSTIQRYLASEMISYKKSYPLYDRMNSDENKEYRMHYLRTLLSFIGVCGTKIVWIDETAVQLGLHRNRAWARSGVTPHVSHAYVKGKSHSVIAAISTGKLEHMVMLDGASNSETFMTFIDELIANINDNEIPSKIVLIMDNASIHKSKTMLDHYREHSTDQLDVITLFLPTYSPFLNPIDLIFGIMKNRVRKELSLNNWEYTQLRIDNYRRRYYKQELLRRLITQEFQRIPMSDYANCYMHTTKFYSNCLHMEDIIDHQTQIPDDPPRIEAITSGDSEGTSYQSTL